MVVKVRNNDELKTAMNSGASTIEIEGDLARKIVRIKATGNVAWAIAFAAIGLAVVTVVVAVPTTAASGGLALPVEGVAMAAFMAPAASVVGFDVAIMAIGLAVAAGGVGVLTRLRSEYNIVEKSPNRIVLRKVK